MTIGPSKKNLARNRHTLSFLEKVQPGELKFLEDAISQSQKLEEKQMGKTRKQVILVLVSISVLIIVFGVVGMVFFVP